MEFVCCLFYVEESRPPLWSSCQSSWLHNGDILFPVRYELNLYIYVMYEVLSMSVLVNYFVRVL
jgi:hypothetical protein